jgi:hypothetical protein
LNELAENYQISLFNKGLMPILGDDRRPDCDDLGYDLGYLRHGSFGRATARWPGGLRRVAAVRWRGFAGVLWPCAGGAL